MSKTLGPMTSSPIKTMREGESEVWAGESPRAPHNIRNIRKSLEQQLRALADSGDTHKLITLLEEGAPFVVDMVSLYNFRKF